MALINVALNGGIAQVMSCHVAVDIAAGKLIAALDKYAPQPEPIHAV